MFARKRRYLIPTRTRMRATELNVQHRTGPMFQNRLHAMRIAKFQSHGVQFFIVIEADVADRLRKAKSRRRRRHSAIPHGRFAES